MKIFNTEFKVYFEDISPSGKIHLEKIAEWMSMTREEYFKTTCPEYLTFIEGPVKMFTTNISISVTSHSRWADKIIAILTTADIKKISFKMYIDFKNERTNQIIATAVQKVVFINGATKSFASVPDDMNRIIINYIKEK